jgi:DNA helicase II / ATP-dependent DNA helicase PcrA
MTNILPIAADNHADDPADEQISASLDLDRPISFFLFADAGSGKTRSLVNALNSLREKSGKRLRLYGRRIGVITYTNAACDEIKSRLEFDPLVEVSTIHSFVWSLISGHNADIKQWLRTNLTTEIAELEDLQRRGKAGSKAALDRDEAIKAKQKRLATLDSIKSFIYNPNGDNRERNSLNHSEVIKIGADFLTQKPTMQRILIGKFPIVMIDESQDTNKLLMEAFLKLQTEYKQRFCLGLFGDVMQRIYADGKEDLGQELPSDWAKPTKKLNHRCPRRIIRLINRIRSSVDGHEQTARSDSEEGFVRLFILPSDSADKTGAERRAAEKMASVTGDHLWCEPETHVKTLILEHHMAAKRMGFLAMFSALDPIEHLRTGLRDGSLPALRFFSQLLLPLLKAKQRGDDFAVAAIVRKASPLLSRAALKAAGTGQRTKVQEARDAVKELMTLWAENRNPHFLDVMSCVSRTGLFEVPESLRPFAAREERLRRETEDGRTLPLDEEEQSDAELAAWDKFLQAPFAEIEPYEQYISGRAAFETHQGVKGREFERVMVVMDDAEARGFMFNYEKLFGAKEKTKTDIENEREGKDSSIERTRRLFYVTCSRAKKSLAIVAYSSNPPKIKDYVVREGWFDEGEIEIGS